jgi:RNase P/RNase MRP subunit p29
MMPGLMVNINKRNIESQNGIDGGGVNSQKKMVVIQDQRQLQVQQGFIPRVPRQEENQRIK